MKEPAPPIQSSLHQDERHNVNPLITSKHLKNSSESTTVIMTDQSPDTSTLDKKEPVPVTASNKSKKALKRSKMMNTIKNRKMRKKIDVKTNVVQKDARKPKAKDVIVEEEDSLHATMDLGGTTIPAEPIKIDSSA